MAELTRAQRSAGYMPPLPLMRLRHYVFTFASDRGSDYHYARISANMMHVRSAVNNDQEEHCAGRCVHAHVPQ